MADKRIVFRVHGMDCAEEIALLKREVGPVVGGDRRLAFDLLNGRMTVVVPGDPPAADEIREAVSRAGMSAEPWSDEGTPADAAADRLRRGRVLATAASGVCTALALASHALLGGGIGPALGIGHSGSAAAAPSVPTVSMALYAIAILCGLWYVAPKAWLALRRLRSDMNLLMSVAVVGAVVIGEWFEAATVSFLFALSLALESWSLGRARRAVGDLLELAPQKARVLRADGTEEALDVGDAPVGSRVVVLPGERIPLDGKIVHGTTSVDEATITGESLPREKDEGDEVFAGTINGGGAIEILTTHPARDTVLARIIRMVGEAQERRAPVESWVDRFSRVYTPVVMLLAAATAVLPPLLLGQDWEPWIYKGLVLLVIACPCALVISTPVSIVAAVAAAAKAGVLIKGGLFVEIPARLKSIALDKTGTITEGRQRVAGVIALHGTSERDILQRAAALEARSGHPLARAITAHAAQEHIRPLPARNVQDLPGRGVSGEIDGTEYWVGSHRFMTERDLDSSEAHEKLAESTTGGRTVVALGNGSDVLGFIALEDAVRAEAASAVAQLRALGVRRVVMLTGDNTETAEAVARTVGIDDVRAELLPQDKVRVIEELAAERPPIAMVGDGVNDAPAMARADVGIAMGAAGSDAAIEAADIALMSDDLARLPWLIRHSKRTLGVIRQNIVFALAVKAAFVALTFFGYASLWAAIAADMGASLLVIGNGLRLLSDRGDSKLSPESKKPRPSRKSGGPRATRREPLRG